MDKILNLFYLIPGSFYWICLNIYFLIVLNYYLLSNYYMPHRIPFETYYLEGKFYHVHPFIWIHKNIFYL